MKKTLLMLLVLVAIGCHDATETLKTPQNSQHVYSDEQIVAAIDDFGKTLALASNSKSFRAFLKEEAQREFDYDYDILYEFVRDRTIDGVNVHQFLADKYSELVEKGLIVNPTDFDHLVTIPFKLQISIPKHCDEWNTDEFIPEVVVNTYVFRSDSTLASYNNSLAKGQLKVFDPIEEPVIVVGQSERIDSNGLLKVNEHGLVIPENIRISAYTAYLTSMTRNNGSRGRQSSQSPFIQIIDNVSEIEEYERSDFEETQRSGKVASLPSNARTNATLTTPSLDARYSSSANAITLNWIGDVNASGYEVFVDEGFGYGSTPFGTVPIESFTITNLIPGKLYRFRVRAFDSSGYSLLSNEAEIRPSPRFDGSDEFIRRVYITQDRFNQIEPGLFGRAELEVKVVKSYVTSTTGPSTNVVQNTFYRDPRNNLDSDEWLYYEIPLGSWRTEDNTFIINLVWQEDDGYVSVLKSYDVQVSSEQGYSMGIKDKELSFGFTGKKSKTTTYRYEVNRSYFVIGSMPVFFYESPNMFYNLDGFIWRMRNSGETKCPYIGSYDGTDCLVGNGPTYPFSVLDKSLSIENDSFLFSYISKETDAGKCSQLLPGSTLVKIGGFLPPYRRTVCRFASVPANTDPYVSNDKWYVKTN